MRQRKHRKQARQQQREANNPAPPVRWARIKTAKQRRADQRRQRHHQRDVAALHQRKAVPLNQQRPQPQAAQRNKRRIAHRRQQHDAQRVRQQQQRAKFADGLAQRFFGQRPPGLRQRCGRRRLMHQRVNQPPGQRARRPQHPKPHAPRSRINQPGQRRAGQQHADAAQAQREPRNGGKTVAGQMPRNEHRTHQKCRRTANADQHLPKHQRAVTGRQRRQRRAGHRNRKRRQHRAPDAVQVNADAHEQLHRAKGKVKSAGKQAQRLRAQVKFRLQRRCHERSDGAVRLAERKSGGQCKQHDKHRPQGRRGKRDGRWRGGLHGGLEGTPARCGRGCPCRQSQRFFAEAANATKTRGFCKITAKNS